MILKKVLLKASDPMLVEVKEEYLMYVRVLTCLDGILKGEILKLKPIDECWDQS